MKLIQLQAFGDLLRRYGEVFRTAWSMRAQLDGEPKLAYERAFLPANLELVETPVHPAPRWTMRILVVLAMLALLLAFFGRLDIVAVAEGKLIPGERVKIIQPAMTGVVRSILVEDGQRIQAGQLLMQLDATQAAADSDNARRSRIDAALAAARSRTLLDAQQTGHAPVVPPVDGASVAQQAEAQHFAHSLYREYQDKLNASEAERRKREAELETTRVEIGKLSATAPLARQQANEFRALATDKYVAQTDYLTKEQTALEQEHDLAARESSSHELMAAVDEQRADIASITSAFRSKQLDELDKATQQYGQSRNDETKADTRQKLLSLTAPVAGTVQQLTVHTLGGVATAAQAVMEIVPDDTLEVEANIENKDIGFVRPGQTALVKVTAFPYTRFGYLKGTVVSVSNDAVQDRKHGLMFVARVHLPTNRIRANGAWVHLTPGMEVTAEIQTGKRSVAHYFLDPVIQSGEESLRER
ncbi:MAG TPA: HlyD family type I secretion periplasmic adaptor subunit [Paraburkholderia sp.]|jgi:hemolysin D